MVEPTLLVDARRAAAMLAISPRTLWSLTNNGEIQHVRIGRAVRYSVEDLRKWVEAKSNETTLRSNPERPGGSIRREGG